MKTCVFVGPTLPRKSVQEVLPAADVLPPVQAGSVYRALVIGYRCMAIIDGLFEQVPTVWHKEILFAISRGVKVYGSSSMGALRAAELHSYGMVGVGKIFEAFRSGDLEGDDEVAVTHAAAEDGFRELCTAMVNIRFGLRLACEQGVLPATTNWLHMPSADSTPSALGWRCLPMQGPALRSAKKSSQPYINGS